MLQELLEREREQAREAQEQIWVQRKSWMVVALAQMKEALGVLKDEVVLAHPLFLEDGTTLNREPYCWSFREGQVGAEYMSAPFKLVDWQDGIHQFYVRWTRTTSSNYPNGYVVSVNTECSAKNYGGSEVNLGPTPLTEDTIGEPLLDFFNKQIQVYDRSFKMWVERQERIASDKENNRVRDMRSAYANMIFGEYRSFTEPWSVGEGLTEILNLYNPDNDDEVVWLEKVYERIDEWWEAYEDHKAMQLIRKDSLNRYRRDYELYVRAVMDAHEHNIALALEVQERWNNPIKTYDLSYAVADTCGLYEEAPQLQVDTVVVLDSADIGGMWRVISSYNGDVELRKFYNLVSISSATERFPENGSYFATAVKYSPPIPGLAEAFIYGKAEELDLIVNDWTANVKQPVLKEPEEPSYPGMNDEDFRETRHAVHRDVYGEYEDPEQEIFW